MNKNRMFTSYVALALGTLVMLSSCASIFTKGKYPLMINSEPDGASVTITNKKGVEIFSGQTPATLDLKSSNGFFSGAKYQVKISHPGYEDKIIPISSKVKGWYFANILLGGVIGMVIVDPATGHMWKLDTKYINAVLTPRTQADCPRLQIFDINQIPEEWKTHLVSLD